MKRMFFGESIPNFNEKKISDLLIPKQFRVFSRRLYGNTGLCSACNKLIPAFEMVMRAKRNVYHLECFACQQCSHR